MWFVNVIFAFPAILLIIALSVVLGKGLWQAFVAIGLTGWVDIARIVRGQFFSLRKPISLKLQRQSDSGPSE